MARGNAIARGEPMNLRPGIVLAAVLLAVCARAELVLKGFTIVDGTPRFSLYSSAEKMSRWVSLGQSFSGYKLTEYDPQTETLTVVSGEVREALRLQGSRVTNSGEENSKNRLRILKGVDLAYELAKSGDNELANMLKIYQGLLQALADLSPPTVVHGNNPEQMLKRVKSSADDMRARIEKTATEKAALILATFPSSP